jgi:hypothetical protein
MVSTSKPTWRCSILRKPTMPQFSIPDRNSRETFASPRKSLLGVGVVCALSAVALFAGRTPSPPSAGGVDHATQPQPSPTLDSRGPQRR